MPYTILNRINICNEFAFVFNVQREGQKMATKKHKQF